MSLVGVFALVAAVFFFAGRALFRPGSESAQERATSGAAPAAKSPTRAPVPAGVVVPGPDTANVTANVAKPTKIEASSPGSPIALVSFGEIKVDRGAFTPQTIAVHQNDALHLTITAVDRDYDFTQPDNGLFMPLPKGQPKRIEFQASQAGKFIFYCRSCGGPDKGPVGYLIVVPR